MLDTISTVKMSREEWLEAENDSWAGRHDPGLERETETA